MKKLLIFILTFISIFSFSGCKKKEEIIIPSENLTNYEINLSLDVNTKSVEATQTIDYYNSTGDVLKILKLHLYVQNFKNGATETIVPSTKLNQAYPNGMDYADFNIKKISCNNTNLQYEYENDYDDILSINLNNSLLPNNRVLFEISYNFAIPNCCHRFGYGANTINLANFYPIMCVYENDKFNTNGYHPNGDPFYSDISNYCVSISTDSSYVVAGSGTKSEKILNEKITQTTFQANGIRDFAIVLSDKFNTIQKIVNNTTINYYYFNDNQPEKSLQAGVDAIKTFSEKFGTYPYKTFSIVKTDFVHGGMEYPTLIMISSDIENYDDYLNVIIHETAHQWWYGIVGNDQFTYPWLDEALTEYSTILFYDSNPNYPLNHSEMVASCKENYTLFVNVYEEVLGSLDTSMRAVDQYNTEPEYTYCTYVKGVLMFDSLFQLIGETKFYNSLKSYFNNNKFSFATPNSLINAFNTTCKQDYTNFFNSWLNGKVVVK